MRRDATDAQRPETVATLARIRGRVQGVGYRYWAEVRAKDLGLAGYVRNLSDGSVEALLVGPPQDVGRMLSLCEEGPPHAEVTSVETTRPTDAEDLNLTSFRRAPTGDADAPAR